MIALVMVWRLYARAKITQFTPPAPLVECKIVDKAETFT